MVLKTARNGENSPGKRQRVRLEIDLILPIVYFVANFRSNIFLRGEKRNKK